MSKRSQTKDHVNEWRAALETHRASLPSVARVRLDSSVNVWLPGQISMPAQDNVNVFLSALEDFLISEGITVTRPGLHQDAFALARSCNVLIAITLSAGSAAEAVDFANNKPHSLKLCVFTPFEFRDGYVHNALRRLNVVPGYFELNDIASMGERFPMDIVQAIEKVCSMENVSSYLEDLDEGMGRTATVLFITLLGVRLAEKAGLAPYALAALYSLIARAHNHPAISLHTSLFGVIVIVRDAAVDIPELVGRIVPAARSVGLAIRVGIAHGDVDRMQDIDGTTNYVGPAINIAARIALSPDNSGVLLDSSYVRHAVEHLAGVQLEGEVEICGKRDEKFKCRQCACDVLDELDASRLPRDGAEQVCDAVLLAFDLPKFSDGDRATLARRFIEVAKEVWSIVARPSSEFHYSPGGDGGVIVIPSNVTSKGSACEVARKFFDGLVERSRLLAPQANVKCRIGLHYGQVRLYNAGRVRRPAGPHLFAADLLASDEQARKIHGIVISGSIGNAACRGSDEALRECFTEMAPIPTPAGELKRYARKIDAESKQDGSSL